MQTHPWLLPGKPGEKSFSATADAVYDCVIARKDIDPKQIIPTGWSIGGWVAVDLAHRRPAAGLATFSAFKSMAVIGKHLLPILPVSLFLRHRFENVEKVREMALPMFMAHGRQDEIVPNWMNAPLTKARGVTVVPVGITK